MMPLLHRLATTCLSVGSLGLLAIPAWWGIVPASSALAAEFSTTVVFEAGKDGPLIHVGPAAYSDLVNLEAGTIGVLYEAGQLSQKNPYQQIRFSVVTEAQLKQ